MSCSERQLWYLFYQFGASTRALAVYGAHPDRYEEQLRQYIDEIHPDDLPYIFQNPGSSQNSHYIITIYPREVRRGSFGRKFASRRVFDMVWEKHLSCRVDLMKEFYDLFLTSPIKATPAGWVFKDRMHQLLKTNQTLQLFPILPHCARKNVIFDDYVASKTKTPLTEFQLTGSKEHRLVEGVKLRTNHYCRPESSNFAAVDSVLLIDPPGELPILFMFRMAWNKTKHGIKLHGLPKVDKPLVPPDTRKYLVIVTPENIHPGITVPVKYFSGTVDVRSEETDRDEGEDTNKDQDEETDEDQDEETDEGQDEETDDDQGEETDDDQGDAAGGAQWALFRVFHYPVDLDRLFDP